MGIQRALISVSDKSGVVEFAQRLAACGVEIISTGGTARALEESGVTVQDIQSVTGWPEMLGGRVKTLHPRVHGGILGRRNLESDTAQMTEHDIPSIDLVVVNLYPFEQTVADGTATLAEAVEKIDIGGPTMVRASAKNHAFVTVVVDPSDYHRVATEVEGSGETTLELRRELATKAFALTARYDAAITAYLTKGDDVFPGVSRVSLTKVSDLRYGENPHQQAALYQREGAGKIGLAAAIQHQGKPLSFNNIVDADAAYALALDLPQKGCAVIKHTNPCGAGTDKESLLAAYEKALAGDPVSAFGGIVAVNSEVEADLAKRLVEIFLEVVIAPAFSEEALEILSAKKNLRVMTLPRELAGARGPRIHDVAGGVLLQDRDEVSMGLEEARVVSERQPTDAEWEALHLARVLSKHVKSNAIVFTSSDQALGVGAGQMSRIDAAEIASKRARFPLEGSAVGSDAFFPFRDAVDVLAKAGATAVVQPGGSIRDDEVIAAANEHGMAMVMTGTRHFRH